MNKKSKSSILVTAAVTGLLTGTVFFGGCTDSKAPSEQNGCGGANGCGGDAGCNGKEGEKNGCGGANGCNGKEGEKNGCNGHEAKK